jgi:hypothetical protein
MRDRHGSNDIATLMTEATAMITIETPQSRESVEAERSAARGILRRPASTLLLMLCMLGHPPMAASSEETTAEASSDAENEQSAKDFPWLLANWQSCFTKKEIATLDVAAVVAACDRAATSVNLSPGERRRLTTRRLKLLESTAKKQETSATSLPESK